jgi:hypothetical protein
MVRLARDQEGRDLLPTPAEQAEKAREGEAKARAESERLRAEVEALRAQLEAGSASPKPRSRRR